MKTFLATLTLLPVLASCAATLSDPLTMPLQERMRNPLIAERYWAEMAEHMADFVRTEDPIAKDPLTLAVIDAERLRALDRVAQARALKKEGIGGGFLQVNSRDIAVGETLLRGRTLSFGTNFLTDPQPSTHVYLTMVVDPRDAAFPDGTSLDLGELQTPYGAQEYAIPEGKENGAFRTVVLYDTKLKRLIGFAQLAK